LIGLVLGFFFLHPNVFTGWLTRQMMNRSIVTMSAYGGAGLATGLMLDMFIRRRELRRKVLIRLWFALLIIGLFVLYSRPAAM
jgi:hypothetical protein